MKTLENYIIVKETEWAILIKAFVSELEKEVEFWLPKSKAEKKDKGLEIDTETWETKIEELKTPQEEECVFVYVDKYEELEKSYKLILTATLKKINTNPWAFVPKTLVKDLGEIEENERGKFYFKIPLWFWEKNLEKIISDTLEFFNKDKEKGEEKFKKNDFKLWSLE
jgi:hypothetical protein